jgi:ABC-type enterochelin transport system substrate-binding protein
MKLLTTLAILVAALFLMTACGGGDEATTQAEDTAPATEAAPAEAVAVHDCDGGCGMKAVPEDKMTEVGGKWFCAGCVDKAKEAVSEEVGGHG